MPPPKYYETLEVIFKKLELLEKKLKDLEKDFTFHKHEKEEK